MSTDHESKICPDCGEQVRATARICRFCRYEFPISVLTAETARAREDAEHQVGRGSEDSPGLLAAPPRSEEPAAQRKTRKRRALPLVVLALVLAAAVAALAGRTRGDSVSCESAPEDAAAAALLSSSSIGADLEFQGGAVAQALCVDFTGDGDKDLVASVSGGGSGGATGWAAFKNDGDSWRLVLERAENLGYVLSVRESQVVESLPLFEEGKPAVGPRGRTGRREFAYQWDGNRLTLAGPAVTIDEP